MNRLLRLVGFLILAGVLAAADYFPPRGEWAHVAPAEAGMDAAKLQAAVDFAVAHESKTPRDLAAYLKEAYAREPNYRILGPTRPRGGATGLVIRQGKVVAQWGEPDRTDMTFSVAKTFVSTTVGLAFDRGLIRNLDDRVVGYLPDPELFSAPHNAPITWDHLLRQTSDWSGTLWGVPDWADRPVGATPADYPNRPQYEPGTHFKYNDVRVNLLALVTLNVWREPLPAVIRREVMDPIGASSSWRWLGYENSWVVLDGQQLQSVSGGGHFGGGMFINAWDLARFGYLFLRGGAWDGRRLISEKWIALARTPGTANPEYGFMNWYLNPEQKVRPATPASSVCFVGAGQNIVYLDWEHDLLVVVRWIDTDENLNYFLGQVIVAIEAAK